MGNRKYATSLSLILAAIIGTIIALVVIRQKYPTTQIKTATTIQNTPSPLLWERGGEKTSSTTSYNLPPTLLLKVPFTPQAPTGNWDELHNEACEEASAIMINAYFEADKSANYITAENILTANYTEKEIANITKWFKQKYGYNLDTTSEETAEMIRSHYGLHTQVMDGFSENDIKQELSHGHIVLISFNGQLLNNPYYKQPGPIHHMMVLKGYTNEGFVTNDPGTKRGMNYVYDFDTLYTAAADWDHSLNKTDPSKKIAIVVWKE